MNSHEFLDDDAADRLAQFVLGTLPEEESRSFRLHIAACETCRREADEMSAVARALDLAGPRLEPRAELWSRIRERIRAAGSQRSETAGAPSPISRMFDEKAGGGPGLLVTTIRAGESDWRPTGVPGVDVKTLNVDRKNDRATILTRMAPGASYPAHVHAGQEECYVLQGDLREGDRKIVAGDYQRAAAGSRHDVQSTREGCLLLIVSSLGDRSS